MAKPINPPVTMTIKMVSKAFLSLAGSVSLFHLTLADCLPEITGAPFYIQGVENILSRAKQGGK